MDEVNENYELMVATGAYLMDQGVDKWEAVMRQAYTTFANYPNIRDNAFRLQQDRQNYLRLRSKYSIPNTGLVLIIQFGENATNFPYAGDLKAPWNPNPELTAKVKARVLARLNAQDDDYEKMVATGAYLIEKRVAQLV